MKGSKHETSETFSAEADSILIESASHAFAEAVPPLGTRDPFDLARDEVWFTTEKPLIQFDNRKTWFSPDKFDSWKLVAQRVASEAVNPETRRKYVDPSVSPHLFVNRCKLAPSVKLFQMQPNEAASLEAMRRASPEFAQLKKSHRWMGLPADDKQAALFADVFCEFMYPQFDGQYIIHKGKGLVRWTCKWLGR